jgi:hypothetical protein
MARDDLPRQRRGTVPQMYGRYPDYDCLEHADHWDEVTRKIVAGRVENVPVRRFFDDEEAATLEAFCNVALAQDCEPRIPVLAFVDEKLAEGRLDGFRYAGMPDDRETWRLVARALDGFADLRAGERYDVVAAFADGRLDGLDVDASSAWSVVMRGALAAFYSHPWAWNEIGFGGPAYPRGYMRLQPGHAGREPYEGEEAFDVDPVPDVDARGEG